MTGSIDPISTFLSIVEAWAADTYVNIEAFKFVPKEGGRPGEGTLSTRGSRAARDLQEAVQFARWQDSLGNEVYVRMATGRRPGKGKTSKRGQAYFNSMGGRVNASHLKSFYIDVDVKPGAYNSTQEAIAAVLAMCAAIKLPRPSLVVYSGGGGFHAHWVLTEPVSVADWDLLAPKLAAACRQHGVLADLGLTVNPVCLLRIPGTTNRKYGEPRTVLLDPSMGLAVDIKLLREVFGPFEVPTKNISADPARVFTDDSWDLTSFTGRAPVVLEDHWLGGISLPASSLAPYTLEEIIAGGCGFLKDALATQGKHHREPLWFHVSHVASFTAGGLEDFHRLSRGHPGYEIQATEAKFERAIKHKLEKDQGWPLCATIQNDGATECKSCPHLVAGKSPLNFAIRATTPTQVTTPGNLLSDTNDPQAPVKSGDILPLAARKMFSVPGYVDTPDGIYTYMGNKDGVEIQLKVFDFPAWNLDYLRGADGRMTVHFDTQMATEEPVHITMKTTDLVSAERMRDRLVGYYGLSLDPNAAVSRGVLTFMASFKSQLRMTRARLEQQELMGWSDLDGKDGNPTGFIYGPTKFNCKGNVPFFQSDKMIREQYFPTGSIEPWMDAIRMINAEKRPEMDLLVATAFGAPLMRFTGEKGVVISAFSSGTAAHKTSGIKVGQSVWGAIRGINQLNDTLNSVMERTGKTRITPAYYDEMKSSIDAKQFIQMIYTFVTGRGKGRLNRNADLRDVVTWETLLVGVSNDSLADHVAQLDKTTDAGVARVFEFEMSRPGSDATGQISMGDAATILNKLETNYGHAGLRYAEHLGKSVEWLRGEVTGLIDILQSQLKADSTERFWLAAAAVLLMGAQMANDINLTRFDVGGMKDLIFNTFRKMRVTNISSDLDISKKDSVKAVLAAYINTHRRSIIATDTAGTPGRGGAMNPVNVMNNIDIHLVNEFTVRYIDNTKALRFSKTALQGWLTENHISPGVIVKNMMSHYHAKEIYTTITSGTSRHGAKERVIEIDLNHPDLVGLYEV